MVNLTSALASIGQHCGRVTVSLDGVEYSKERPDFVPLLIDPGWRYVCLGDINYGAEDKLEEILGIIMNAAGADVLKMPGKRDSLVIVRGGEINRVLERCYGFFVDGSRSKMRCLVATKMLLKYRMVPMPAGVWQS